MDEMVYKTQQWLNKTYGGKEGYNSLDLSNESLKGRTGWTTIYALTRAFQIELGITSTADNFGSGTIAKFKEKYPNGIQPAGADATHNVYGIIQGALWCKGYSTGHYPGVIGDLDTHFDDSVANAIKKMKTDAGLTFPDGVVTLNVMKALLSMDYFVIGYGTSGTNEIRIIQQELNRDYEAYIGLMPCDGVYGRNTNKALVYALQAEEGLPVGVANGNFGPTTQNCCPTIPYSNGQTDYNGRVYTSEKIFNITQILQHSLYCNKIGTFGANGMYDDNTKADIKEFQRYFALSETGVADLTTWLSLLISCGDTSRPAKAFDCATILTPAKAATLKNAGYEVGGRYLSGTIGGGISKALSNSEIQIIFDAGLRFFPIYQSSARSESYFTPNQGVADANHAFSCANGFGIPYGSIIYFAVDFDAMDYQITDSIIPYFKAVYETMLNSYGMQYRIGIYGARNICTRVCDKGYACSSFVGDMSTGFSGNLGFNIPENWAFDQFATVTIGSGDGQIEIDKDGYSGKDKGVSFVNYLDNYSMNESRSPTVYINRSNMNIPVYSKKDGKRNEVDGDIIGYIKPNQFYTRYHTGTLYYDPNYDKNDGYRWILNGDYVHAVIFTNDAGKQAWGYIKENDLDPDDYNFIDSSLPYQEPFHYYNFDGTQLVPAHQVVGSNPPSYIFTVKRPVRYFRSPDGTYLGTLPAGTKLLASGSGGGLSRGWCMYFDEMQKEGEFAYEDLDSEKKQGAFVELGYDGGSFGNARAIW